MSDTDIYKKREAMPMGKKPIKKKRPRRTSSRQSFDDPNRKRRSKNTGLRRLLHLARKSENEKVFWSSMGIIFVVLLIVIAFWQFVIAEHLVRQEEAESDYIRYQHRIPESQPAEAPESPDAPAVP